MSQFPAVVELSALDGVDGFVLDGTEGFRLDGGAAGDLSGFSVSAAGDVNGDGLDDVLIGAYRAGPNGDYSGAAYVVYGKAGNRPSSLDLSTLGSTNGFRIEGAAIDDQLGRSVAAAGDVNGDGIGDIIVGAGGVDAGGRYSNNGASYVIFGRIGARGSELNVTSLNGSNGFRLIGGTTIDESHDQAGRSVSSAGDINGDGFDDLIVGAYRADPNGNMSGSSYVVFGKSGGFAATVNLATLTGINGFRLDGLKNRDATTGGYSAGYSIASAGDINGDGLSDLLIGSYRSNQAGKGAGSTHVVFGKEDGFASAIQLSSLDGEDGFRLDGGIVKGRSGRAVASAGDINGDGYDDIVIGAFLADPPRGSGPTSGSSYVVFGTDSSFPAILNMSALNGRNGFRIDGAKIQERSGVSVDGAGDVNGDGFDDVIIGAYYSNNSGENSGASYVVFGKASGFASVINLSTLNGDNGFRIDGVSQYDMSGRSVSAAGDVNGDGFDDLLIGAPGARPNGQDSGASYIVYGHKPDTPVVRKGNAADQTLAGGDFADTLRGLAGNDHLYGHGGNDKISGGGGSDRAEGEDGNDTLSGGAGRDKLAGGDGNDRLYGDDQDDNLGGGSGHDVLFGGAGADRLFGGGGRDVINGGPGNDGMVGGGGADVFSFTAAAWGGDVIVDFEDGLDLLRFRSAIADRFRDFTVMGNGTTEVTIAVADQTLVLRDNAAIFISGADFEFIG